MKQLIVNSAHIALALAWDCLVYTKPSRVGRERSLQSPEVQQAKIRAAREKRLRKQLKRVQEGH